MFLHFTVAVWIWQCCLSHQEEPLTGWRAVCRECCRVCVPSGRLYQCKEAPSTTADAATEEIAKSNKLAETATGAFLIRQAGLCNLESNIQRRSSVFYLKDDIFLKVLI